MGKMGGRDGTGRQDYLGREEPNAEEHLDVAGDWADAVTGSRTHQLAFGLGAGPRSVPTWFLPSWTWRPISSWLRRCNGADTGREE